MLSEVVGELNRRLYTICKCQRTAQRARRSNCGATSQRDVVAQLYTRAPTTHECATPQFVDNLWAKKALYRFSKPPVITGNNTLMVLGSQ